jgi:hypothetical protein
VEVVVAVTVLELAGVEVGIIIVTLLVAGVVLVVDAMVEVVIEALVVEAFVLVDEEQDTNNKDVTMRIISDIEIIPLFIWASYFINNSSKLT